jgi:hypothetical protein
MFFRWRSHQLTGGFVMNMTLEEIKGIKPATRASPALGECWVGFLISIK